MKRFFAFLFIMISILLSGCEDTQKEIKITDNGLPAYEMTEEELDDFKNQFSENKSSDALKAIFHGAIGGFYADLNNDGEYEIYFNMSLGYGIISNYAAYYNHEEDRLSEINRRFVRDYSFFIYNDEIFLLSSIFYYGTTYNASGSRIYKPVLEEGILACEAIESEMEEEILLEEFKIIKPEILSAKKVKDKEIEDLEEVRKSLDIGNGFNFLSGELYLADLNYDGQYEVYSESLYENEMKTYFIECYDFATGEYSIMFNRYLNDYRLVLYENDLYLYSLFYQLDSSEPYSCLTNLYYDNNNDSGVSTSGIVFSREFQNKILDTTKIDEQSEKIAQQKSEYLAQFLHSIPRCIASDEKESIEKEYRYLLEENYKYRFLDMYETDLNNDGGAEILINNLFSGEIQVIIGEKNTNEKRILSYGVGYAEDVLLYIRDEELYIEKTEKSDKGELQKNIYKLFIIDDQLVLKEISNKRKQEILHDLYPYKY
ncbi:MAG: hypothetical protein AB1Z23_02245 [Eubacteriales bacterium]